MPYVYQCKRTVRVLSIFFLISLLPSCSSIFVGTPSRTQTSTLIPAESSQISIGFSPYGSALELILQSIEQAKYSIRVASYSFTSRPIANALIQAFKRGVDVRVIADKKANQPYYSAVRYIASKGIPTKTNDYYQIFHHKFIIIDGKHTETGSFNYTAAAASKNAENALMIWNNKKVARIYTNEWNKLWKESELVLPKN